MTVTHTRTDLRQEVLARIPMLGFAAVADTIGPDYIDDDSEFGDSQLSATQYKDLYIHRYQLLTDDRLKQANNLDSALGRLYHESIDAYADQSTLPYELLGMHPDELNAAIQRATFKRRIQTFVPFTIGTDMDTQESGVVWWDGSQGGSSISGAIVSKDITPANVLTGTQSLFIGLTAPNGYARSQVFTVSPLEQLYTAILVKVVGTVKLKLWDATHSRAFSGTYSYSGTGFIIIWRQDQVPAGCTQVQVQIEGTGSTDEIYLNAVFGPYANGQHRYPLQSWIDEPYKLLNICPAHYRTPNSNLYDPESRMFYDDWQPGPDFWVEAFHREANPYHIIIGQHKQIPQCPMWLKAERTLHDVEPLDTETDSTSDSFEILMCYVMVEVLTVITQRSKKPEYLTLLATYQRKVALEEVVRPSIPVANPSFTRNIRA